MLTYYGSLKLRRLQINRRLRLKHNLTRAHMHNTARTFISDMPYKTSCYHWYFKIPLNGIQYNYSIRSAQRRKKKVNIKK